jgi:16S rRNA (cytosine967-C5)-methyltransferase
LGRDRARETAFTVVDRVMREGAYLHLLLRSSLQRSSLDEKGRAFVTELATGTVRMLRRLDHALARFIDRPLDEVDPKLLNLLRTATYQIMEMQVPPYAAVNQTVDIAKRELGKGPASFTNATLRALADGWRDIEWPPTAQAADHIGVVLSYPAWMASMLIEDFGDTRALSMAAAGNRRPPLTVRVNTLKREPSEYLEHLHSRGWPAEAGAYSPEGITNLRLPAEALLAEWKAGNFAVQDESSMLVSHILDPQPGERIVDACAAPGGKATHLAQLCRDDAEILAFDSQERRLGAMREMVVNMGIKSVRCVQGDSRRLPELLDGKADRILVDAPCSGLGTLRRRPDIKWKRRPEDIEDMAAAQDQLMEAAAEALRPGGVLVYSVCTITRKETVERLERFLDEHKEFAPEAPGPFCPMGPPLPQEREDSLQTYTDLHGLDGMFICRLRKS